MAFAEQRTLDSPVGEFLVAVEDDFPHLHLVFLVDEHIEHHLVLAGDIVTLLDIDLSVLIAFVVEVFLGQNLCAVYEVLRQTHALGHAELCFKVLALTLLHTVIGDFRDFRAQGQMEGEIDFRIDDAVGSDAHFREQSVFPVAFHGLGNLAARYADGLPDGESGESGDDIVLVAFYALNVQSADDALPRCAGIGDVDLRCGVVSE